ncbi:hypothetical protein SEA_KLEVEY_59 [Arthrobacter phage Klevey]|uniref:Uncharacterized protein n=1 Tax=Arthrobacter phage Klevey TaxID=2867481 RepID=A0AAE8XKD4_9CAUD|nr:hypothetical protein SEA_KLEVEY_59 [Arthrobacter phage Klevey]
MTRRLREGELGDFAPPGTAGLCNYSPYADGTGMCGKPAVWHMWPGSPPDTRADSTAYSCEDHPLPPSALWDWHRTDSGACAIPGAYWRAEERQGEGRCVHEIGGSLG